MEIRGGKEEDQGGDDDGRTGGRRESVEVMDPKTVLVEATLIKLSNCLPYGLMTVEAWDTLLVQ